MARDWSTELRALRRGRNNVSAARLDTLLRRAGFTSRQQGTSHKVYTHPRLERILSIPQRRTVRAPCVDQTVKAIREVTDDDGSVSAGVLPLPPAADG